MIGFVQTEKGEKMARYIDADTLKLKWLFRGKDGKPYRDEIDAMPTADVVEVGRCGECRFTDGIGEYIDGQHWCVLHGAFMNYCSDFEREVKDEQIN